jgi:hypothetical protein
MTLSTTTPSWRASSNMLPPSRPGDIDTTQKFPLGSVVKFRDVTLGEAEFIYLAGAANTVAGDAVSYNTASFATTRAAAGAGIPWAIAWATAATVASTWGWYQLSGQVVANKTKTVSMAAGIAVGISTAALVIHSSSLKELLGAWVSIVASATTTTLNGDKVQLTVKAGGCHLQGHII